MEEEKLQKLNCSTTFAAMALISESISALSSNPLFSAIITLYTLILLYFPSLIFSPVLISTSVLLFSLLRLGATQRISRVDPDKRFVSVTLNSLDPDPDPGLDPKQGMLCFEQFVPDPGFDPKQGMFCLEQFVDPDRGFDPNKGMFCLEQFVDPDPGYDPKQGMLCFKQFVGWDLRAPLEVIYEEEDKNGDVLEGKGIQRCDSLSRFYPDSDSGSDSGSESMEVMCLWWEDERDELIEIELGDERSDFPAIFEFEEDNLIEIDLSPAR